MAVLDPARGVVVVRLVYDGPPRAGKTTSVRSLARSLARSVVTPLEAMGRTMYFDWMEYTGGLFEGHQIRCQIVSVPGQPNLAPRRRALLSSADAVVFVADTGDRNAAARSGEYVASLSRLLSDASPPVGLVVQANKRDLETAVPRAEIQALLGGAAAGLALTESVAGEGLGIRETFVLAVRLALDRVRELIERGELPRRPPDIDSADELLASLERTGPAVEAPSDIDPEPAIARPAQGPRGAPTPPNGMRLPSPRLPDSRVPSGAIWPAVGGRMILHEATANELQARRGAGGAWVAGIGTGWRIHSAASARFSELDRGREAVLAWARVHAARVGMLSPGRCIVVADAGEGEWRLWQIVRVAPSLREALVDCGRTAEPEVLLESLAAACRTLAEALTSAQASGLATTFDTIGQGERGAQFVALMPGPTPGLERLEPAIAANDVSARTTSELESVLTTGLWDRLPDMRRSLERGSATVLRDEWSRRVAAAVSAVGSR